MQAQGYVKGDCRIHLFVRLHSPNTADLQNESTERTLKDTFEALHSTEVTLTWPLRLN